MITADQKPIREIKELLLPYENILILGCGTCVKTCFTGGDPEVAVLASLLRLSFKKDQLKKNIEELTVERQCEDAFIMEASGAVERADVVLSLGCGAGVQAVSRRFPRTPIFPGVNTTFIGVQEKPGLFTEECVGCGNCQLALFGGVCPITRCSKKLLNGPCGGSRDGKCEISPDIDCAWKLIIDSLKKLDRLDNIHSYIPPKDWRTSNAGGPRKLLREDLE